MFISVIIPCFNEVSTLEIIVDKVLTQKKIIKEIILINDGSTDGTAEVAAQFRDSIQYVYQRNAGPSAARNRGIKMARGNVIAFLDADDWWSSLKRTA